MVSEALDLAPAPDVAISLRGIWKSFGGQEVLRGVDLEIPRGGICVVIGMSGAGKSVLSKLIMGLIRPEAGAMTT